MDSSKEIIDLTVGEDVPENRSEAEEGEIEFVEPPANEETAGKRKRNRKPKPGARSRKPKTPLDDSRPHKIISLNGVRDRDADSTSKTNGKKNASSTDPPEKGEELETPPQDLFFIDIQPSQMDAVAMNSLTQDTKQDGPSSSLLLPAHVSVFGTEPVEILPESDEEMEEGLIEYLDSDRLGKGMVRYFESQEENENVKMICKNCGGEGHKAHECTVMICLTCGVWNEHSTRSCPVVKSCFNCGMKGHISATCPNRGSQYRHGYRGGQDSEMGCHRCGSGLHMAKECPTLWRLYEYVTSGGRDAALQARLSKQSLKFGEGGEGYIAVDEWCFNCGGSGHWGDDCKDIPHPRDFPDEPSAFSNFNLLSGPFYDDSKGLYSDIRRRTGSRALDFSEDWGHKVSDRVGKQARQKQAAKLDKKARQIEEEDDEADDWFGKRTAPSTSRDKGLQIKGQAQKIQFGRIQGPPQASTSGSRNSKPSLLSRMTEPDGFRGGASRSNDSQSRPRESNRNRDRDRDRSSGHYKDRRDDRHGSYGGGGGGYSKDRRSRDYRDGERRGEDRDRPRYRGGYSR